MAVRVLYSFLANGNMKLLPVFKKVITGILHFFPKHTTTARAQLVFPTKNRPQYEKERGNSSFLLQKKLHIDFISFPFIRGISKVHFNAFSQLFTFLA